MARHIRIMKSAYNAADKADPNCSFLIGAAVAIGNRIISTGACTTKTHPLNPKLYSHTKKNQLCAEIVAILKSLKIVPREKIKQCRVYVTRKRRDGKPSIAKPCKYCRFFLKNLGIETVFYTDRKGKIRILSL
jgi:cytidine deaminase